MGNDGHAAAEPGNAGSQAFDIFSPLRRGHGDARSRLSNSNLAAGNMQRGHSIDRLL